MTPLRSFLLGLALALAGLPAAAGGISFDLPHLQFPPTDAQSSRDCPTPTAIGATQACR